jgi:filamentous hemagglutinin
VVDVVTGEVKVLTSAGKLTDIPATPIPTGVNASVVPQSSTGIKWGGGIQEQGLPFENYLEGQMATGTRLPANFKTFDFFDAETGLATSVKTLDTTTAAKVIDPGQVYSSIKGNVDSVVNFSGAPSLSGRTVDAAKITTREVQLAVPAGTNSAQWAQINKAIQYGQSQGVAVRVTVVK